MRWKCVWRTISALQNSLCDKKLWLVERIPYTAEDAIIIQNMVVECRTGYYKGDGSGGYSAMFYELSEESDIFIVPLSEHCSAWGVNQGAVADDTKSESLHGQLTQSFAELQ